MVAKQRRFSVAIETEAVQVSDARTREYFNGDIILNLSKSNSLCTRTLVTNPIS